MTNDNTTNGFASMAQRIANGEERFIAAVTRKGFTRDEAARVLALYRKERIVKVDGVNGDFKLKHGAFLDNEVLRRAVQM